jgi:hypothetical protein
MKLAILLSFFLALAAPSVSSVSFGTTEHRNLEIVPGANMDVNLNTADVDVSTKTFTYNWALGSEIELGTNFGVELFDSECWSKNGSPMATPEGFTITTTDAVTTLTYTDVALFRERQTDGTIGFCMVARSYLEGPLYIDFKQVKTIIQLTNIDQIVGPQEIQPFAVEESTSQTSFQVEIPLLPKETEGSPRNNKDDSSWPGEELESEEENPLSTPLGLGLIIGSTILLLGAAVMAVAFNRPTPPIVAGSDDVPFGASDGSKGGDSTDCSSEDEDDDEEMAEV